MSSATVGDERWRFENRPSAAWLAGFELIVEDLDMGKSLSFVTPNNSQQPGRGQPLCQIRLTCHCGIWTELQSQRKQLPCADESNSSPAHRSLERLRPAATGKVSDRDFSYAEPHFSGKN